MHLFILRHGDAERRAASDRERQLTERGKQEVDAVVQRHQQELVTIDAIFVSPLTRAQQTAAIVNRYVPHLSPQTVDLLTPSYGVGDVIQFLGQQVDSGQLLLVSHQPLVTELVSGLCDIEAMQVGMHTGALASITLESVARGMGRLHYVD